MTARRRPSTWANWRTPVHEPGRTARRAEPPVDARWLRLTLAQRLWWRRRREIASSFPARIARKSSRACFFCCSRFKTASFVCLVRMTGERGSTQEVMSQRGRWARPFPRTGRVLHASGLKFTIVEECGAMATTISLSTRMQSFCEGITSRFVVCRINSCEFVPEFEARKIIPPG